MNATKHGLTAQNPVLPTDDRSAYDIHKSNWTDNLKARSFAECHLAEVIIDTLWRLKRIPGIEEKLVAQDLDALKIIKALDNLSRHESRLRKIVSDSLKHLGILQDARRIHKHQQELAAQEHTPPDQDGFVLEHLETMTAGVGEEQAKQAIDEDTAPQPVQENAAKAA